MEFLLGVAAGVLFAATTWLAIQSWQWRRVFTVAAHIVPMVVLAVIWTQVRSDVFGGVLAEMNAKANVIAFGVIMFFYTMITQSIHSRTQTTQT